MTKLNLAVGSVLAVGLATGLLVERSTQATLRELNRALRRQIAQSAGLELEDQTIGSRTIQTHIKPSWPQDQFRELLRLRGEVAMMRRQRDELEKLRGENQGLRSNLLVRVLYGWAEPSRDQIEAYLGQNRRSAEGLLVAFSLTRDPKFLEEAEETSPHDPRVNCVAACQRRPSENRRGRLDAFKQSAPENALANYLSAQDYLKSGETAPALQELIAASGKARLEDYSADFLHSAEEAYRALGYPEVAAQAAAWISSQHGRNDLAELSSLQRSLAELAGRYRQSGDEASARAVLDIGLQLGERLADEPLQLRTLEREMVGLGIQRRILELLDPASPYDDSGRTVQDRLEELIPRREEINRLSELARWDGYLLSTLSQQDLLTYFARLKSHGEVDARRWASDRPPSH